MEILQDFCGNFQVDSNMYMEKQRAKKLSKNKVEKGSQS